MKLLAVKVLEEINKRDLYELDSYQRKAEEVMSKNVDYFYKAGDPDQSIFEFAGANPDSFHREFKDPEIELKEG